MAETIGTRIAQARYRKGWSRRQVVEAAANRISETALRNIEKGYSEPFPQTVHILASALDVEPSSLFAEEGAA